MDDQVFNSWMSESRAIKPLTNGQQWVLFVDNCSEHFVNDGTHLCPSKIWTNLKMLPPNATHLVQPVDSFIIRKIKDAWRSRW